MLQLARNSRQAEIFEVVLSNGWDYMRALLSSGKTGEEPDIPPPAVLRNILTDLGPVYIKLGQLMSTRPDLIPPDYIQALSALQSKVPPVPWSQVELVIRQNLPQPPEEIFSDIDPEPLAAGSMAQVHRARLQDGRDVVMKVQRPGIEALVERDVELIKTVAKLVSSTDFGKSYDVVGLADEFGRALYAELDFTKEANYTDKLRQNLGASPWFDPEQLKVPTIEHHLSNRRILVMEWLEGVPLLSAQLPQGEAEASERKRLTTMIFRAFFQQFLSDGFFHADPHPGNIFYLNDGRLALLDCGMVGSLDPRTRSALTEMLLAIVNADASRCAQLSLQLAEPTQHVDLARLEGDYERLLRRYYNLSLSELNTSEAFYELLQAARCNHLRWPGNIGLFAKSLGNLEGVARQFYPSVNVLEEVTPLMTDVFRKELIGEDPLQALFRTTLEFKNLSLESPRQLSFLLNRLSNETLRFNVQLEGLEGMRRSIEESANRRTFGTVLSALILGAAILSAGSQTPQVTLLTNILFGTASLIALVLLYKIVRSGQLK
jgi:predicted unusual protein kinase regulating ubiquinone biosynthesis (AarF/ABC1/UbiB family)